MVIAKWVFLKNERIYLSNGFFVLGFLCVVLVVQFLFGTIYFFGDVVVVVLYFLLFFVAIVFGGSGRENSTNRECIALWLASTFVVGGLLSLFVALRQWLLISNSIWETDFVGGRPFANIGQPNNFSTLLCLSVASAFYLYERKKIGRFLSVLMAVLLIFGIALSQSRTPWVSILLGVVFVCMKRPHIRLSKQAVVAWCFLYFFYVFSMPLLNSALYLDAAGFADRDSASARINIWLQLLTAIKSGDAFGYGWNQVAAAQAMTAITHPVHVMVAHSHNILLDMLVWNGPFIGVMVLVFFFIWCIRIYRGSFCLESKFSLLSMLLILVHGFLEFPLEYAYFLFPFGVFFGLASSSANLGWVSKVNRWGSGGLLVVASLVFFIVWRDYRIVEENYSLVRFKNANIQTASAVLPITSVVLLTQLKALVQFSQFEPKARLSDEELVWVKEASYRYPYSYNLFKYSYSLAINGRTLQACNQMLVLQGLHTRKDYESALSFYMVNSSRRIELRRVLDHLKERCSP